jgi:S-DNA-T family DNA segregation ATPase FtsK/SpoIIIE
MLFKKKKRITVTKRTEDSVPFVIPQMKDKNENKYRKNHFASPIFGTNVKDEVVIPTQHTRTGDYDLQYDSFRTEPKLTKEERSRKYGSEYHEFDLIKGNSLNEALDFQNKRTKAKLEQGESTRPIENKPFKEEQNSYQEERYEEPYEELDEDPFYEEKPKTSINDFFGDKEPKKEEVVEEKIEPRKALNKYNKEYVLPPLSLLKKPLVKASNSDDWIEKQISVLDRTLEEFGIGGKVIKYTKGPTVTRFEISLDSGVNVRKVTGITDNLKMALAAKEIRIEAPIPGKTTVGIEVPNLKPEIVHFVNIVSKPEFKYHDDPLTIALGLDIDGKGVYTSIAKMPHGLVAGATGSGKSVCINTVLMSLLFKYDPDQLKLMLIDPKMVELSAYNDLPHLITPVITDAKVATAGLKWAVEEMERRFVVFKTEYVKDITTYNDKVMQDGLQKDIMPYIVIVVDELADLMMIASSAVEEAIMRLTQKARAAGIHLIIATQRPSTDVVKGTIKSNIPTRIAFSVSSYIDSMTIIDSAGADKLLGRGDMLFAESGQPQIRVQGAYISDDEIMNVNEFIRKQRNADYLFSLDKLVDRATRSEEMDELTEEVARYVVLQGECSINRISKEFKIGFNRAQKIVEILSDLQVVSDNLGSKARTVNATMEDLDSIFD